MSREYPSVPIAGVAGLILHEKKVLLTIRGKEPSKGMWGIPGGVVEVGETLEDAVKREVLEETGLQVKPIRLITIFDTIRKDCNGDIQFHYILFEYLCEYISGDLIAGDDAPDARWVSVDCFDSIPIMPSTRRFIEKTLSEKGVI